MSRCFPFPPPGYEKKPSNDHEDLLIKEKQKEKKRRKEKKDKEKREGKERKEKEKKDHSKDRHKEKKDKKDKHRDKDKKKPKDRDKDKKKIFNERKSGEHTEGHNGGNPGEGSCQAEFIKDPKFTGELDRKIKDEENGVDNPMAGKIGGKVQRAVESMGSSREKKGPGNKMGASDKVVQNITIQDQKVRTAASAVEKRGTEDGMHQNGADNQIVAKITGKVQRALEGMGGSAEKKGTGNKMVAGNKMVQSNTIPDHKMHMSSSMEKTGTEDKMLQNGADNQQVEKFNGKVQRAFGSMGGSAEKKVTTSKMVTGNKMVPHITTPDQKMHMVTAMGKRGTEGEMLQNSICEEQRRVNEMDRQMAQDVHKKTEGKERTTAQELDRHKDRVQDKVHKEKKKEREKEKKKEKEKRKEKEKHKHKEQDKQRDIQSKEQEDSPNVKSLFIPEGNLKSVCADGSLKRKQTNGFLHENEMRYNKLPRLASSSKLPLENGRKLDQSLTGSPCASDNHKSVNLVKVEMVMHVENKVNGVIDIRPPSSIPGPQLISTATQNGDSCKRPPHPDEKYLSEILRIPRMEEWPEFDDQDWLLGGDNVRQKPKIVHNADESPQVWASALRIETADVVALPYVIPY